jgi:hypothetical protein
MSRFCDDRENRKLEKQANAILRSNGYRIDGRKRGSVSTSQDAFERRARPNPFGGWSRKRRG